MKQALSIPAHLIFTLADGTLIPPQHVHEHEFRFQFIDWNFVQMIAVYLKMLSKQHHPGVIRIYENKVYVASVDDSHNIVHQCPTDQLN